MPSKNTFRWRNKPEDERECLQSFSWSRIYHWDKNLIKWSSVDYNGSFFFSNSFRNSRDYSSENSCTSLYITIRPLRSWWRLEGIAMNKEYFSGSPSFRTSAYRDHDHRLVVIKLVLYRRSWKQNQYWRALLPYPLCYLCYYSFFKHRLHKHLTELWRSYTEWSIKIVISSDLF